MEVHTTNIVVKVRAIRYPRQNTVISATVVVYFLPDKLNGKPREDNFVLAHIQQMYKYDMSSVYNGIITLGTFSRHNCT